MKTKFRTFILLFAIGLGIEGCKKDLDTIRLGETYGNTNTCNSTLEEADYFLVEGIVVDAEFDKTNNSIVMLQKNPIKYRLSIRISM